MKKFFSLIAFILLFSSITPAQQDLINLVPKRERLLNGLPLLILERPGSGSVAFHLVIKSGATFDTSGKAGLADMTSQMLLRGAGGWTSERLKEELDDLGARLEINTSWDSTEIRLLGNGAKIDGLIELLGRLVTQSKFPAQEIDQLKAERIKALENVTAPSNVADDAFNTSLYGSHPYGHSIGGTKESLTNIGRFDLVDFYDRFYLANNAALVIAGEVTAERAIPILRRAFGGWRKGQVIPYTFVPPKPNTGVNIRLLERPDQQTTEIRLGTFALRRADKDYLPMQILVNILNQRLAKREGPKFQASMSARKMRGPLLLSASVPSKDTAEVLTAVIAEIKRLGDVDQTELQTAKDRIVEEYKTGFNTNTELAARWAELENYDLGSAYLKNFITQAGAVSVEDLRRVSGQYLSPENLTITVLGPAGQLETDLKKLGKVEIAGVKK